jgi:hypothetical protein
VTLISDRQTWFFPLILEFTFFVFHGRQVIVDVAVGEFHDQADATWIVARPVREGVSKGEEDGRRSPALRAAHRPSGRKAVWGVARPQGV